MARTPHSIPVGLQPELESSAPAAEPNTEVAYRVIKAAIIDGSLPPGTSVSEQQLASRLNMSRTPVHQGLVRLEQEEWVKVNSRKGVQVAPIVAAEMKNIYETLMALEGAAVRRLAQRPEGPADGVDAQLLTACAEAQTALEHENLTAWAIADNNFHTLLMRACGNPRLANLASSVMEQAHRARLLTVRLRPWPESSNDDHRRIVDAIIDREPLAAREALESHRQRGIETLIPVIEAMLPSEERFTFRA
jgi:DNA-binding GntR family transcriptional regulator